MSWKFSPNMWVEKVWLIRVLLRQWDELIKTITVYKPECQKIHHVRGLFSAHAVQFYLRAVEVLVQTPSTPFCGLAPGCGVTNAKTLPAPVCCSAHVLLISWWETLTKWLRHREDHSAEWVERLIQKWHPQKAPIRGESVAYLGWDGKMGMQTWTDEDQWWEIQQSMGGEGGRLQGYEQMEEWQNGTSVWWGEMWRKEGKGSCEER